MSEPAIHTETWYAGLGFETVPLKETYWRSYRQHNCLHEFDRLDYVCLKCGMFKRDFRQQQRSWRR